MTMRLVAGREQILSRTIPVEKGLYVLVHEGSGGPIPINVYIASAPNLGGTIEVRPMNSDRAGFIKEGEFALVNARANGEIIAVLVGDAHQARTDLRLVALDKSRSQGESSSETTIPSAPELRPRITNRLIELPAGIHLVRFSRTNRSDRTRLMIGPLSKQTRLSVSAAEQGCTELTPGGAAVIELPTAGQVMLSLVTMGITPSDFAGITIEPLIKLLERVRRARPQGDTVRMPRQTTDFGKGQPAITGFRTVWPNRPLGLDMAISGYLTGGRPTGSAVMSSAWVRAPAGEALTGLKCSLIGVNRLKWEIKARLADETGQAVEQSGTAVNFADQTKPMAALSLELTNVQGDRQSLTLFFERLEKP